MAKKYIPFEAWCSSIPSGDKRDKSFIRLTSEFLNHPAFTCLSRSARLLYIYMASTAAGKTSFKLTHTQAEHKGFTKNTFDRAKAELVKAGFISEVRQGRTRQPNEYRFTPDKWKT